MTRTSLPVHHGIFKIAMIRLQMITAKLKAEFYNHKITSSEFLFKVVDTLVHHKLSVLPSLVSKESLSYDSGCDVANYH